MQTSERQKFTQQKKKHWSRITITDCCWSWNRGESLGFGVKLSLLCEKKTPSLHHLQRCAPVTRGPGKCQKVEIVTSAFPPRAKHNITAHGRVASLLPGAWLLHAPPSPSADPPTINHIHASCARRSGESEIRVPRWGKKHIPTYLPRERNALTALQLALGVYLLWSGGNDLVWFLLFSVFPIQPFFDT